MYRCEFCNTIVQKRNKTKHSQSKKHTYFSNLILNRYVIKLVKVDEFKDISNPYFTEHTKKIVYFSVQVVLKFLDDDIDCLRHKTSVSNNVTYNIESENYSTYTTVLAPDFVQGVIKIYLSLGCSPQIIPEIEIVFISNPKDITRQKYLEQQKSMLCRKLVGRFHESTPLDFEYNWLPDSFKDLRVCFTFEIFYSHNFHFQFYI